MQYLRIGHFCAICLGVLMVKISLAAPVNTAPAALADFITASLRQQPQIMALRAKIAAASANSRASGQALYNPELEFDFENATDITKSVGLSQTVDWGGKKEARMTIAQAELALSRLDYTIKKQTVIFNILQALAAYKTSVSQARLRQKSLHLMAEFRTISERRYQAGDLNQIDLNLARLAHSQARMESMQSQSAVSNALAQLRTLIGYEPKALPELPEEFSEPVLPKNIDQFLQRLPVIERYMTEIQIFRHQLALRKRERIADPTVGITAGKEGENGLIGLSVSVPLNVRNNYQAEVDVAYQNMLASEYEAHQRFREIKSDLQRIAAQYQNVQRSWRNWTMTSQNLVDAQLELVTQKWQAGDISASDYLIQLKQVMDIQATGLELRNALWQTVFKWMELTASIGHWLNIKIEEEI